MEQELFVVELLLNASHHGVRNGAVVAHARSEEHTSELQSQSNVVCRLLLEKKNRHIDKARARKNDGDIVCAATLRQARIAIHAVPLANNTKLSHPKDCVRPAANVIAAKSRIAKTTTPSTEKRLRIRGKTVAPASAPNPNDPSNNP